MECVLKNINPIRMNRNHEAMTESCIKKTVYIINIRPNPVTLPYK